jgi:hypothetical protein
MTFQDFRLRSIFSFWLNADTPLISTPMRHNNIDNILQEITTNTTRSQTMPAFYRMFLRKPTASSGQMF